MTGLELVPLLPVLLFLAGVAELGTMPQYLASTIDLPQGGSEQGARIIVASGHQQTVLRHTRVLHHTTVPQHMPHV